MKKIIISVMCVLLLLSGCDTLGSEVAKSEDVTPTNPATVPAETSASEAEPSGASVDSVCKLIQSTLSDTFENVDVSTDGTTIVVDISHTGVAAEVAAALNGDGSKLELWNGLASNIVELATASQSLANSVSAEEYTVMFNLLNDEHPENALLVVFDGEIIYDVANS